MVNITIGMYVKGKQHIQNLVLCVVSGIHWGTRIVPFVVRGDAVLELASACGNTFEKL